MKIVSLATQLLKRNGAKSRGLRSFGRYFNFQLLCNTEALSSEPMAAPDRLFRAMSPPFLVIESKLCYGPANTSVPGTATVFGRHSRFLWHLIAGFIFYP
jgi:hypothetical protein